MAKFTPKQFIQQCESMARELPSAITDAVMESAIIAERHFDENFDKGGFQGDNFQKWADNSDYTVAKKGHSKVLHQTGKLRKSRRTMMGNLFGFKSATIWYSAFGKNGVDYAPLMQDGFKNPSRDTRNHVPDAIIPARPFIGGSRKLDGRIKLAMTNRISRVFQTNYTIGR